MKIKKEEYDKLKNEPKMYKKILKALFKGPKALDVAMRELSENDKRTK